MGAYCAALAQGIDAELFWRLTPYQVRLVMQGNQDQEWKRAWYFAALSRQKKLMTLETLLGKKKDMSQLKETLNRFRAKGK